MNIGRALTLAVLTLVAGACGSDDGNAEAVRACVEGPPGDGSGSPFSSPESAAADCVADGLSASDCDAEQFITVSQAVCALKAQANPGEAQPAAFLMYYPKVRRVIWLLAYSTNGYFVDAITGKLLGTGKTCATAADCEQQPGS